MTLNKYIRLLDIILLNINLHFFLFNNIIIGYPFYAPYNVFVFLVGWIQVKWAI